jgi:hypothetical protein
VREEEDVVFLAFKVRLSSEDNAVLTELLWMEAATYTG